jgi:hypothetical protein
MRGGTTWLLVIAAVAALDLVARFGLGLELEDVLWIEALLFVVSAGVLCWLYRGNPAAPGWRRAVQLVLIASLLLAAVRSGIWASGQPVVLANAVIVCLGLAGWVYWRYLGRSRPSGNKGETL